MSKIRTDIYASQTACRFWKSFDVAYVFYKILENDCKVLHALEKCFPMHFAKNLCIFYATCKTFSDILVVPKNYSKKHTKIEEVLIVAARLRSLRSDNQLSKGHPRSIEQRLKL